MQTIRIRLPHIIFLIFIYSYSYANQENPYSAKAERYRKKGIEFKRNGDFLNAKIYYDSALNFFSQGYDTLGIANTLNNLGIVWLYLDDAQKCLENFQLSEKYYSQLGYSEGVGKVGIGLSTYFAYFERNFNRAYVYLKKCEAIFKSIEDNVRLGLIYNNLGNLFFEDRYGNSLFNVDSAIFFYNNALSIHRLNHNANEETGTEYNIARCLAIKQQYDTALSIFDKIRNYYEQQQNLYKVAAVDLEVGNLYRERAERKKSIEYFQRALSVSQEINSLDLIHSSAKNLADMFEQSGRLEEALQFQKIYVQYNDSLYNFNKLQEIEKLKISYETEKKEDQIKLQEAIIQRKDSERRGYLISLVVALTMTIVLVLIYQQRQNTLAQLRRKEKSIFNQKVDEVLKDQELKSLNSLMEGQESERKRIARELHDRLGSILSAIKLYFDSFESIQSKDRQKLDKASQLLDNAVEEVREISHNLVSGVLSKFGLKVALNDLQAILESTNKIKIDMHLQNIDERLGSKLEIALYRITQEMISNTLKHAQTTSVTLQLIRHQNNSLTLMFEDNGKGFDASTASEGMGLKNIEARLAAFGGSLHIDSRPGKGTILTADIPEIPENNG